MTHHIKFSLLLLTSCLMLVSGRQEKFFVPLSNANDNPEGQQLPELLSTFLSSLKKQNSQQQQDATPEINPLAALLGMQNPSPRHHSSLPDSLPLASLFSSKGQSDNQDQASPIPFHFSFGHSNENDSQQQAESTPIIVLRRVPSEQEDASSSSAEPANLSPFAHIFHNLVNKLREAKSQQTNESEAQPETHSQSESSQSESSQPESSQTDSDANASTAANGIAYKKSSIDIDEKEQLVYNPMTRQWLKNHHTKTHIEMQTPVELSSHKGPMVYVHAQVLVKPEEKQVNPNEPIIVTGDNSNPITDSTSDDKQEKNVTENAETKPENQSENQTENQSDSQSENQSEVKSEEQSEVKPDPEKTVLVVEPITVEDLTKVIIDTTKTLIREDENSNDSSSSEKSGAQTSASATDSAQESNNAASNVTVGDSQATESKSSVDGAGASTVA